MHQQNTGNLGRRRHQSNLPQIETFDPMAPALKSVVTLLRARRPADRCSQQASCPSIRCGHFGLRSRPRFSGVAREPLANQTEKAFDVGELSTSLLDLLVGRVLFENWLVRLPKAAEALFSSIPRWNFCPEPCAGLRRAVPDHEGDDLPRSAAQRPPKPAFARPLADASPAFVEFENVAFLGRRDLIG